MAQLADILIGSTLPLHPRFGKNPWISLQLLQDRKTLDETRAVAEGERGIWEINSVLNLPDTTQLLTLAVVVHSQDSKRRLVSATFRIESLFARLKASPNEYYEFITCDSCASLQIILSCLIKRRTLTIGETPSPHSVVDAKDYGSHEVVNRSEQKPVLEEPNPDGREDLRNAYTRLAYLPNSDKKINLLSTIGRAYRARYQKGRDAHDLDNAISIHRESVDLGYFHPQLARHLEYLSRALEARYDYRGNRADIEEAIQASQKALGLTQQDAAERADLLVLLASNHDSRFKRLGDVADIDMAVSTYNEGVALMPEGSLNKAVGQSNFAGALLQRFERLGGLEDLEKAIFNLENAVRLTPDEDPYKPSYHNNLGNALQFRFECLGNLADLNKAISYKENAMRLTPDGHPEKPSHLNNLGSALHSRFKHLGDLADLNKAISDLETAVSLTPDGHSDKPSHHSNLGNSLESRFERLGDIADLEMAISNKETAVSLVPDGHADKPSYHNNLGIALRLRFERLGGLADLNQGISNLETAVRLTPDGHADKPSYYNNLGIGLISRFKRLGDLADLNKAISDLENAVKLTPDGHPDKPLYHNSLGNALQLRFGRQGDLTDLNKAIFNQENAMRLTPDEHPDKALYHSNLGSALDSQFRRLGDLTDLNKAISNQESAARLTPDGHPDKPLHYNTLGITLKSRFERLGDLADLEMAISNNQNAVRLTPDGHPQKPSRYSSLGNSLQSRFKRLGDLTDLKNAIFNQENAVKLTPDGHPDKPSHYTNLVAPLNSRFERLGDLADLNKAISNQENALSLTPDGNPGQVSMTFNLARCYERRFEVSANRSDLDLAHSLYASAAQSPVGYPRHRFRAAFNWARCAKQWKISPLSAYRCVIDQLPGIAWLGIPVGEQHSLLEGMGGVVRDAIAAAIEVEEYEMAVEWMEQGRSIVWQNLLKLRTPMDDLRANYPSLADRLHSISRQLDSSPSRELEPRTPQDKQPQEVVKSHSSLGIDWDETVEQIRRLPNFESFLKPKVFESLAPAAHDGPVVILNVAQDRCDALALVSDGFGVVSIVPILLENFSLSKGRELLLGLTNLLALSGVRDGDMRAARRVSSKANPNAMFKSILRTLWVDVVKPVMEGLAYQPRTDDLTRIWWCATGPLAFLPIHAAGDYDTTEVGHKVSDYVVSSYTPTLTAILDSLHRSPSKDFKLLMVAQPLAPGVSEIPKTMEEIEKIANVANGILVLTLAKEEATVELVQRGMRESNWIHLACHGKQDASKPLDSGLILHDGTLKLSTIIRESLPDADFAFLSACQTAMGDEKVMEEAAHLAAGMLLAGYKGVIATMWSIRDDIAPQVAEVVYSRMLKDGNPNRREAAHALHEAVKRLREAGADFTSWVPFIHIGR